MRRLASTADPYTRRGGRSGASWASGRRRSRCSARRSSSDGTAAAPRRRTGSGVESAREPRYRSGPATAVRSKQLLTSFRQLITKGEPRTCSCWLSNGLSHRLTQRRRKSRGHEVPELRRVRFEPVHARVRRQRRQDTRVPRVLDVEGPPKGGRHGAVTVDARRRGPRREAGRHSESAAVHPVTRTAGLARRPPVGPARWWGQAGFGARSRPRASAWPGACVLSLPVGGSDPMGRRGVVAALRRVWSSPSVAGRRRRRGRPRAVAPLGSAPDAASVRLTKCPARGRLSRQ